MLAKLLNQDILVNQRINQIVNYIKLKRIILEFKQTVESIKERKDSNQTINMTEKDENSEKNLNHNDNYSSNNSENNGFNNNEEDNLKLSQK